MGYLYEVFLIITVATIAQTLTVNPTKDGLDKLNMLKITYNDAVETYNIVEVDVIGPLPNLGRSGIIDPTARWSNNMIIYEFDPKLSPAFQSTILKAMNHISGRTCVSFKERMNEVDHIFVTQGVECSSSIGKRGGRQLLSLGPQCSDFATHVHLLVHTIGFGHEHNRADRDDYLTINYGNIDPINHSNFDKYPELAYSPFSVPYDYSSITHFGPKIQSTNGQDTIVPKQVGAIIGEAKGLSELDIKKINNMYCSGSLGMLIRSVYDGGLLDVKGGLAGEGKEVIVSKVNSNQDSQKWTANWVDLLNPERGAAFATWAQDGGRLKVLDEDPTSGRIMTWGYASGYRSQLWSIEEIPATGNSAQKKYLIRNLASKRCLSAPVTRCEGLNLLEFIFTRFIYNKRCKGGQARTSVCDTENVRHLWNFDFL